MTHRCKWHDSFIHMTWRIGIRDMTHSHICRDSLMYLQWLMNICDVPHSYVRTLYFSEWRLIIYMTWLIDVCWMTHSYSWRNALLQVRWLIRKWVISYIHELYLNASCHEHENDSFIIVTWSIHIQAVFSCVPNEVQEKKRSIREYFWSSCHTYE